MADNLTNNSNCCICLEELNLEKYINVATTSCNHTFHTSCLLQCKNNKCPMCRFPMFEIQITTSQLEPNTPNTLVDEYFRETNTIRQFLIKYLGNILYISSQVVVAIFLIFGINIMTTMILMIISEIIRVIGHVSMFIY